MHHTMVRVRYPDHVAAAEHLSRDDAMDAFLATYLREAVYAAQPTLAKHLSLPPAEVDAGLQRLVSAGHATVTPDPGSREILYLWHDA